MGMSGFIDDQTYETTKSLKKNGIRKNSFE